MAVAMPSTSNSARARRERSIACCAVVTGDDELGQQRVEVATDLVALPEATVHADAGAARRLPDGQRPGGGKEVAAGVLAVDAELDGVPAQRRVVVAELLAVGDAELLADQVDARRPPR